MPGATRDGLCSAPGWQEQSGQNNAQVMPQSSHFETGAEEPHVDQGKPQFNRDPDKEHQPPSRNKGDAAMFTIARRRRENATPLTRKKWPMKRR